MIQMICEQAGPKRNLCATRDRLLQLTALAAVSISADTASGCET
jgi:hypothetical protein